MVVVGIVALGCAAETRRLRWRFESLDGAAIARIDAQIERGGCGGAVVHRTSILGGAVAEASPALDAGRFGLRGRAYDGSCAQLAEACVEVTLPRSGEVVIALEPIDPVPCDGRCTAAIECVPLDAGPPDAPFDAGADAPFDAGPVPATPRLRWPHSGEFAGTRSAESPSARLDVRLDWDPVAMATRYEVQVWNRDEHATPPEPDRVPPIDADTATDYVFAPPGAARASWRVRACNALGCSAFSRAWHVEARRTPGDFDDDGFEDLAIGDRDSALFTVVRGRAPSAVTSLIAHDERALRPVCGDGSAPERGSIVLARAGDLDGDGFAELAVGMPSCAGGRGELRVFWGAAASLDAARSTMIPAPSSVAGAAAFGASLSRAGDVDGDGFADLAVGAPLATGGGAAVIAFGGASRDSLAVHVAAARECGLGACSEADEFGTDVAGGGDVDLDGFADVLVGAPGGWNRRGFAVVLRGAADRRAIVDAPEERVLVLCGGLFYCCVPGVDPGCEAASACAAEYRTGTRVALADVSRDGVADVVVGGPGVPSLPASGNACIARPPTSAELVRDDAGHGERRVLYGLDSDGDEGGWSVPLPVWQLEPTVVFFWERSLDPLPANMGRGFIAGTLYDDPSPAPRFRHTSVTGVVFPLPAFRDVGAPANQGLVAPTTWDETVLTLPTLPDGGLAEIRRPLLTSFVGAPLVGEPNSGFGASVALVQFSSDAFQSIAVGAPTEGDRGAVRLYRGQRASLRPSLRATITITRDGRRWGDALAR